MQRIWCEGARVLRPNGKLCINAPIMPIPKAVIEQHTRHLKNIAFDMEKRILENTDLERYSLFIWQKQTSKMMFGSYPQPGNIIENNTVERSEEHTSELQSHMRISYAVFCLKKTNQQKKLEKDRTILNTTNNK